MSSASIYQALLSAVLAVPGVPAVNRPGTANIVAVNTPYIDLAHIPNSPAVFTLGDDGLDQHTGLTQLTFCYPVDSGLVGPLKLSDTLRESFKAGRSLFHNEQEVKIVNSGVSTTPLVEDGKMKIPFTIYWYAYTRR